MKEILLQGNYQTREVLLDGEILDPGPSQQIRNHSPDGFSWSYSGSGCAQLALAVLLKVGDKEIAQQNYQEFKRDIIAQLPQADFKTRINIEPYLTPLG